MATLTFALLGLAGCASSLPTPVAGRTVLIDSNCAGVFVSGNLAVTTAECILDTFEYYAAVDPTLLKEGFLADTRNPGLEIVEQRLAFGESPDAINPRPTGKIVFFPPISLIHGSGGPGEGLDIALIRVDGVDVGSAVARDSRDGERVVVASFQPAADRAASRAIGPRTPETCQLSNRIAKSVEAAVVSAQKGRISVAARNLTRYRDISREISANNAVIQFDVSEKLKCPGTGLTTTPGPSTHRDVVLDWMFRASPYLRLADAILSAVRAGAPGELSQESRTRIEHLQRILQSGTDRAALGVVLNEELLLPDDQKLDAVEQMLSATGHKRFDMRVYDSLQALYTGTRIDDRNAVARMLTQTERELLDSGDAFIRLASALRTYRVAGTSVDQVRPPYSSRSVSARIDGISKADLSSIVGRSETCPSPSSSRFCESITAMVSRGPKGDPLATFDLSAAAPVREGEPVFGKDGALLGIVTLVDGPTADHDCPGTRAIGAGSSLIEQVVKSIGFSELESAAE
jgi:hypothetical protein